MNKILDQLDIICRNDNNTSLSRAERLVLLKENLIPILKSETLNSSENKIIVKEWTPFLNSMFDMLYMDDMQEEPLDALLIRWLYERVKNTPSEVKDLSEYIEYLEFPIIVLNMCQNPVLNYLNFDTQNYDQLVKDLIPSNLGLLALSKCGSKPTKPLYKHILKNAFHIEDLIAADNGFYTYARLAYMDYFPQSNADLTLYLNIFDTEPEKLLYIISAIHFSKKFKSHFKHIYPCYGIPEYYQNNDRLKSSPEIIQTCYNYLKQHHNELYNNLILADTLEITELQSILTLCLKNQPETTTTLTPMPTL